MHGQTSEGAVLNCFLPAWAAASALPPFKSLRLVLSKARRKAHLFERLRATQKRNFGPAQRFPTSFVARVALDGGDALCSSLMCFVAAWAAASALSTFSKASAPRARHLDLKNAVSRFECRGYTSQGNDLFSAGRDLISQFHEHWRRLRMKPPPCMNHSLKGVISKSSLATISPVVVLRACISM